MARVCFSPMRAMRSLLLLALFSPCASESTFSGTWYLVNVNSVVCPGSAGYATVNMTEPKVKTHSPHILTVFRTTKQSVTLGFEITDATGKVISDQTGGVTLRNVARRLSDEDAGWYATEDSWQQEAAFLQSSPSAPARGLSARRRSFSGGSSHSYSSPRRRAPQGNSYSSPRRRAPVPAPAPRPAPPPGGNSFSGASARRRGYTEPASQRRRTAGYDGKHYSNPANPSIGSYGYTNPSVAASNFGGRPPMSTPYGYTGANAYSGSSGSGMQIALAAGGGLLAGAAVSSLLNHASWTGYTQAQMLSMPCTSGTWTGPCSTCTTLHGAAQCAVQISPKIDATRDDLLNTGFIPADFQWPIQVKVTSISGADFLASSICPPADNASWTPPPMKQIFLTLTPMETLSAAPAAANESSGIFSSMWSALIVTLCLCCCCCAGGAFWMSRSKRQDFESGTSSESESDGYPHLGYGHGGQPYGQAVAPAMGPPAYGHNPYWQGGAAAGPAGIPQGPYSGASFVQGSPMAYPQPFQSGAAFTGAGAAMAVGATAAGSGGFMDTAAPSGASWADVCRHQEVFIDPGTGMPAGPWGECLAWAVAYEHQNPSWERDPRFQEGPAQQVINAMLTKAPEHMAPAITQGSEMLEESCHQAVRAGHPLPLINQRIM